MLKIRNFFQAKTHHRRPGLAALAVVLWLPACAHAALEILAEDNAAPWSQGNGTGAAVDIVKAAFAAADVDIALQTVAYARCKHMVVTGKNAACFSMSADPAIADKVVFSEQPLYRNYSQYFHNPQHPLQAGSEADIGRNAVIGIVTGYEYPQSVSELALRGVRLEPASSEAANLKKLAAGRIDAAVVNLDSLKTEEFLTKNLQLGNAVAPLLRLPEFGAYIGFSTQHPQGLWARDKFNEGYARISRDGTLQKIMLRWQSLQRP